MPTGLTRDAGWEIGVSRTVAHPLDAVWALLTSEGGVATWLGPGVALPAEPGQPYATDDGTTGELRSHRPGDRIRLTWRPRGADHESTVQVAVTAQGDRTVLRFHQERMRDADERERQRAHWAAVLDRLVAQLDG